jgi:hypothetical protein
MSELILLLKASKPNLSLIVQQLQKLHSLDPAIAREQLTLGIKSVLQSPGQESLKLNAEIVKECTRLFANDNLWHKSFESNRSLRSSFNLDPLIHSKDAIIRQIGLTMGAVIMSRVVNAELVDIVSSEYSMEKIS